MDWVCDTYKTMYPASCIPPRFYGFPNIHKTGTPLRPVISSKDSVTYGVAKVPTKVLNPLWVNPPTTYKVSVTL